MSTQQHASTASSNEEEQCPSSFCIPDPTDICSAVNTATCTGFPPIHNSVPSVFSVLNNRGTFNFFNGRSNFVSNSSSTNNRNFLFPTDRFNPPLQSQVAPYTNTFNNESRIQTGSTFLSNSLRGQNSVGIHGNGIAFNRFLRPLPEPQGTPAISPSSLSGISVPPVTPSIPTAEHKSLLSVAAAHNPVPSVSSLIPPSLVNDHSYGYLLSFQEQAKIAHKAAMHYANLTEHLMEHARNAAAAENLPIPPLPQAVFSMIRKYDQQEPLQKLGQEKKREDGNEVLLSTHNNTASSLHSGKSARFEQKRSSPFTPAFPEPAMKARHVDSVSNTDTTFSRSESDSSNKTAADMLPVLSPHPYYATTTENNFEQQQNEMEINESESKSTAETVNQPLRTIQEFFGGMNPRHGTKTEHSSDAFHSVLTPSETTLTLDNTSRNACVSNNVSSTLSQPHLDSGISMSVNSTASREQISNIKPPWLTSFTVRDILTENERTHGRVESNHMTEPKTMKSNQMRISNSQLKTKLPAISPSNVLRYPRGSMQNCVNQMMRTPGPSTSTIPLSFKNMQGYTMTTNGVLITPDGQALSSAAYNCFGVPGHAIASIDPNQNESDLCTICGDKSSGIHYSVPSCEGCKGFFRRTIQKKIEYICYKQGNCVVDQKNRNRCQACRFKRCLQLGMRQESVRLDHNRRKKKDESREKELEEIEEMKKLKATVVSAYREAFPTDLMISNRCEARERIHTFLNNIPIMKEINGKDREVVVEKGVYAALALRTYFTTENYESVIGVGREKLTQCLNGLGFDVKEEEMAVLTALCSLQNCMGMVDSEKIQDIGAKLCNCLRTHLSTSCDGVNETICKCLMSVTALMSMLPNSSTNT